MKRNRPVSVQRNGHEAMNKREPGNPADVIGRVPGLFINLNIQIKTDLTVCEFVLLHSAFRQGALLSSIAVRDSKRQVIDRVP